MTKPLVAIAVSLGLSTTAYAGAPPAAELFAPGVISSAANDGSPTFAPDGNTLYFTRSTADWSAILESHRVRGQWSEPQVASFSGEWPDSSPGLAPDGSYLVFVSLRPHDSSDVKGRREAQLYRVDRTADGWSVPHKLPAEVNIGPSIWKPSIAADGTIYFVSIDAKGGKRLYAAARAGTGYRRAEPLAFSDGAHADVDPEITPDGSVLFFCSSGRLTGDPKDHLFVVKHTATGWGDVQIVHYAGDEAGGYSSDQEPHLGPDHTSLYFSSDRGMPVTFPRSHDQAVRDVKRLEAYDNSNSNVWVMPIASVLAG